MKIIHITDFHYSPKHIANQNLLTDALISAINNNSIETKVDFVFFTGDLVLKGGNVGKDFDKAYNDFLLRIERECNIDSKNIYICCGNHDVARSLEIEAIKSHIDNFSTVSQLDKFVTDRDKRQFDSSLDNIKPFIRFQEKYYKDFPDSDVIKELYTIHKRQVADKKIGIASINTAWRSFDSLKDGGVLLFPICFINDIVNELRDCTIKMLMMHHPISDFKEYISYEIENVIYNNFDFLFSGHVHKQMFSTHVSGDEGIFWCVSPASLTMYDAASTIGFSIINVDDENFHKADVSNFIYQKNSQSFSQPKDTISIHIPLGNTKQQQLKFKEELKRKLDSITNMADELFLSSHDDKNSRKFLELFTPPSLKNKSKEEYSRSKADYAVSKTELTTFDLDNITSDNSNYVINGQDKSGKTSLLYKVNIDLLRNFSISKVIPLYIDCKDYKPGSNKTFDWVKLFSKYFQIPKKQAENLPHSNKIRLLIDNYDYNDEAFNKELASFLNLSENITFIICAQEVINTIVDRVNLIEKEYTNLYIYDISRSQIRGLTQKWQSIPIERKEQAIEKIISIFNQLRIPCNYWNVSLFLWIFEKNSSSKITNNVDLIQLYIEKLLDKESLTIDKTIRISFDQLRNYLGELAHRLISNHATDIYSIPYEDLVSFTKEYKDKNIRFVIDIDDIINLIIKKGILKKTGNSKYTFRLNGVFEYFLAVYLNNNLSYRNLAIENDHAYLSFANEFELYAGFNKKDTKFVENILDKTLKIFSPVNNKYGEIEKIDESLLGQAEALLNIKIQRVLRINNRNLVSMSPSEKDQLLEEHNPFIIDHSDISLKKYYTTIEPNTDNLEKSLKILAKVFRNTVMESTESSILVLDYILLCSAHLGFALLDEPEDETDKVEFAGNDNRKVYKLWVNFVPLIIQTILFESLGQDDLERLLLIKLENLKKNKDSNQYILMLVYMLLIDLNPKKQLNLIIEAIQNINIGILQNTLLVKLYYYVIFKSYNDSEFEKKLRDCITLLILKINPKTKRSTLDKHLANLKVQSQVEFFK